MIIENMIIVFIIAKEAFPLRVNFMRIIWWTQLLFFNLHRLCLLSRSNSLSLKHIFTGRRLLNALFLTLHKSRKLKLSQENEATVDVHCRIYTPVFNKVVVLYPWTSA